MNIHLENIKNLLQDTSMPEEEKQLLLKQVADADKHWAITDFKLDRTEKVKRTTAILLEETIEELEQKRKAVEEQNRELEIEASLERIRSVAMSMMKPDDLLEVSKVQFNELKKLGFSEMRNALIGIFYDAENYFTDYDYSDYSGGSITKIPYHKNPVVDKAVKRMKSATDAFTEFIVEGKELEEWKAFRKQNGEYDDSRIDKTASLYYYFYSIEFGNVGLSIFKKINEEQLNILKRFRNVFDLAYRRFVDITNAEAQAKESQIQLALERVRARTMAMQHSDELAEASFLLDTQVRSLGIKTRGCAFNINDGNESTEWFSSEMGTLPTYKTPRKKIFLQYFQAGQNGETLLIEEFAGKACAAHYNYLCTLPGMGDALKQMIADGGSFPERQIDHVTYFKYGYLLFITLEQVPEAHDIFKRFAKVFEQTYTRFLDLQKAEAQARAAQIEAALERVRSKTMAMHNSMDVGESVGTLFDELVKLGLLGVHDRCGIGIMQPDEIMELWKAENTTGKTVLTIGYLNMQLHTLLKNVYQNWLDKKETYQYILEGEDKLRYYEAMQNQANYKIKKDYYSSLKKIVHTDFFFKEGCLYVFAQNEFTTEATSIVLRFAGVFGQTYQRYLDLQKAEAQAMQAEQDLIAIKEARQKAEVALIELQATQKQLIQSEKMASLGELTAGIAHEIQNPLNFVNNFSEINTELLAEMKTELAIGNMQLAIEIANDIEANEEKINHHGKRADAIVKGMLQHSRSSNGIKELTDINALCDEYLRLCYYGLRAKDKSFNATIKTDFDESLEKVNIVPQDIGRVILNILTNAFYAAPLPPEGGFLDPAYKHEPTVWVSTKKIGDKVEIRVRDNGPGIPQNFLDKIFQPFFTTKPTGQGTGLGLSLAYDIVKAHGGELKVETVEEEGSAFTIQLPIIKNQ